MPTVTVSWCGIAALFLKGHHDFSKGKNCFVQEQCLREDTFSDIQSISAVGLNVGVNTFAGRMDGGWTLLFHIIPLLLLSWVSS